jgi:hypothetical protein
MGPKEHFDPIVLVQNLDFCAYLAFDIDDTNDKTVLFIMFIINGFHKMNDRDLLTTIIVEHFQTNWT